MFSAKKARELTAKILDALKELGVAENVNFASLGGKYGDGSLTIKLECAEIDSDGTVQTKERTDYLALCNPWSELKASWLDLHFIHPRTGNTSQIVGAKPRSRKYPIIVRDCRTNKEYKWTKADIVRILTRVEELTNG